jgi:hypothetical protein
MMTKPGRPSFKPTRTQRLRVEELVSCGTTQGEISLRIGISEKTLRLRFSDELAHGRARRRGEVIELLFRSARKGDAAALCKLADMTDEDRSADREAPAKPPLRPRMGKKAAAAEAARTAGLGTDWGTDLQTPYTET